MDVVGVLAPRQERPHDWQSIAAGSRFAEQASWLRTSMSGSIAARRARAVATDGETS